MPESRTPTNLDIFCSPERSTLGKTAHFSESRKAEVTICKSHVKPAHIFYKTTMKMCDGQQENEGRSMA